MGGATDFKVGYKTNFCTPTFPNVGVQASKYQYGPIEYIEICCLVVALIIMLAKAYGITNQGKRQLMN